MNITSFSRRYIDERASALLSLIESELSGAQKCYLIRYYRDEKKIREIAEEYGVCPSTVSRTISRGTAKLQKAVETARKLCG